MKSLNKNAYLLLGCLLLNNITSIFIYTYLLAFILNISANGIINVAIFYLVLHISMIALSWLFAPLFKKLKKSRILRLGVIFKFLLVLMVILLKDSITDFVFLVAVCNACAEVLFWGGANPLQSIVTSNEKLVSFLSYIKILGTVISLVVPPIMGIIIELSGIGIIAIIMCVLVFVQLILSFSLHQKYDRENSELNYKEFISIVKEKYPNTKHIYFNLFLYGICSNISTIVLYYTAITFGSNISLGIFSTLASIVTIVVLALFNYKKKHFATTASSIVSAIAIVGSVVFLLIDLGKVSLIIFHLVWNIIIVIPETITNSHRLGIAKHRDTIDYNIENITISETYLDAGRVVGEILLVIMGLANNHIVDMICLCMVVIVVGVYMIHTIKMKKDNNKANQN